MIRCRHSALAQLCGIRGCHHYGKATPPNPLRRDRELNPPELLTTVRRHKVYGKGERRDVIGMVGEVCRVWKVESRDGTIGSNASWNCRCIKCGATRVILGFQLRGIPPLCVCERPRRSGSGPRKSVSP